MSKLDQNLIVSTHLAYVVYKPVCWGVPVIITSSENQETSQAGVKLWKNILPDEAFFPGMVLIKDLA